MAGPDDYSAGRYGTRQARDIARGVSMGGTNAAAADVVRVAVPDDAAYDKLYLLLTTGATTAGLALILSRSAAGTGALAAIGTLTLTTHASNAIVGISLFAGGTTIFSEGDAIVLQQAAGTNATTPVANVTLGWREKFTNLND